MKAWQIKNEFGVNNLAMDEVEVAPTGPGQVKLRMLASSMNYRDLVIVEGQYGRVVKPPVIPLSDGVGEVVEVGKDVSRFKLGDRVCPIFFPDWLKGEPSEAAMKQSSALGASSNGTLCEFMVVDAERAVKVPEYLTPVEAASLPCAGVTAWNALNYGRPVKPGELVLVQGTGGVAIFALQFAKMLGARAVVISSSDEKLKMAQELGADFVINYRENPEWHQVLRKQLPDGVDRVIEVGGADTLNKSLKAVRLGGILALVGILSGGRATLDLPLVVMRNVRLEGITVGSRDDFEAMLAAMEKATMHPRVGATVSFAEAPKAFELVKAGGTFGKICISR
jgi:NADPH:quinone reductase-like Zn-dependent oxidoreductase